MLRRFLSLVVIMLFGLGTAQTYVQLLLDASGSMWNKLADGQYRIVAAKDVLSSFVSSLPADPDLNVGLRVYGSRIAALDEGSCEDSELFVPMSGIARDDLLQTVRSTQATGATPIAYSLQLAGQDFPAEGKKVIILVTDGEESCGGDVRGTIEALKAQGIEFELNIIGFDLDERAIKSFEGLGTFENATSATELASALGRAVEVEQAASYKVTVTVTREGAPAADGVTVDFLDAVVGERYPFKIIEPGMLSADLPAGAYSATVQDAFSDKAEFSGLSVTPDGENRFSFELAGEVEVTLSVSPTDPITGSKVSINFENAPAGERNWITVVPVDVPDNVYLAYAYVSSPSGSVELSIPGDGVPLEARYHLDLPEGGSRVIGRSAAFTPVQASASLSVAAEVAAGTAFEVIWTGPNNDRDYITVVPADAAEGSYKQYRYTREGSPMSFTAAMEPGTYEVRYQSDGTTGLIARQSFSVIGSEITLSVPDEVEAGKSFDISWTGPNGERDYITVVPADAEDGSYTQYVYTRGGSPMTFIAPLEPGVYELRYQSDHEAGVFARQAFRVSATTFSLQAPESVMAGSHFEVSWTGPNGNRDYITVVPADSPAGTYKSYRYTRDGSPLTLQADIEPGAYEVRYQSDSESGVFARIPIRVTAMQISLSAAAEVAAGERFDVHWTGPNGASDYLTIVPANASDGTYASYRYTREGNTLSFQAPDEPGQYEIRYQSDRESGVFARIPLTVR